MALLEIRDVEKSFHTRGRQVPALAGVSLTVENGQSVGLIGESGSGKSTLGRVAVALTRPDSGTVHFTGHELTAMRDREVMRLRSRMQVVFQEPYESLNPRMRIGQIVGEPLAIHEPTLDRATRLRRTIATLETVGLDESYLRRFPRELSGGQQQRVGIARAVATRPSLVVLDEPTSSLDVSVRALILQLLRDLQRELGLAYLFISHDISTVEHFCSTTAVMYRGRLVESGDTEQVLGAPAHPYTKALLSANLSVDKSASAEHVPLKERQLAVPDPAHACVLVGRCPIEIEQCSRQRVELRPLRDGRHVACIRTGSEPTAAGSAPPETS